jgi:hypothetical protein
MAFLFFFCSQYALLGLGLGTVPVLCLFLPHLLLVSNHVHSHLEGEEFS